MIDATTLGGTIIVIDPSLLPPGLPTLAPGPATLVSPVLLLDGDVGADRG